MKNSNLLGFVLGYLAIVTVPGCGPGTQPEGEGGEC
jgi:hypothetical protein